MNAYEKAAMQIRDRRRATLDEGYILWQEALQNDDALYAAFKAYQSDMIAAAQGQKNTIKKTRAALDAQMKKSGIDKAIFEPPYACEKCKDTGRINGRYCSCAVKLAISSDRENLAIKPLDFETSASTAPSAAIKKAYAVAQRYIDSFPGGEQPFLVLAGAPGTGKTVLAAATTGAFMQKGASAVTVTAFDFVRRALDYHTQFSIPNYVDRFSPMLDCDLLVIDDLGTESVLKNVTKEYLYTVINERWLNGKYTVATTNRTPSELLSRYGESIFSRLCDKSKSIYLSVDTKNKRISD